MNHIILYHRIKILSRRNKKYYYREDNINIYKEYKKTGPQSYQKDRL